MPESLLNHLEINLIITEPEGRERLNTLFCASDSGCCQHRTPGGGPACPSLSQPEMGDAAGLDRPFARDGRLPTRKKEGPPEPEARMCCHYQLVK